MRWVVPGIRVFKTRSGALYSLLSVCGGGTVTHLYLRVSDAAVTGSLKHDKYVLVVEQMSIA